MPEQQAAGAQVRVLGQRAAAVLAQLHERAQVLGRQRDGGRHGRLPHAQHLDAQRELRRNITSGSWMCQSCGCISCSAANMRAPANMGSHTPITALSLRCLGTL